MKLNDCSLCYGFLRLQAYLKEYRMFSGNSDFTKYIGDCNENLLRD